MKHSNRTTRIMGKLFHIKKIVFFILVKHFLLFFLVLDLFLGLVIE